MWARASPLVLPRNGLWFAWDVLLLLLLLLLLHVLGGSRWWFLRLLDQQRPLFGDREPLLEFRRIGGGGHSHGDR